MSISTHREIQSQLGNLMYIKNSLMISSEVLNKRSPEDKISRKEFEAFQYNYDNLYSA